MTRVPRKSRPITWPLLQLAREREWEPGLMKAGRGLVLPLRRGFDCAHDWLLDIALAWELVLD
jgi:hypothetical protein